MTAGPINTRSITAHWDEILRLTASIKTGTVTASLMLRKLGSYPRQNGLALALRELGRLERSLFILDWLQNPDLRRRVTAGLNKSEARNALARAVFFNRLGELRDHNFEHQRWKRSSAKKTFPTGATSGRLVLITCLQTSDGNPSTENFIITVTLE